MADTYNQNKICLKVSKSSFTLLNPRSEIASKPRGVLNKGVLWDLMLLKVILKPIKVMITCKKLDPYLKISTRYWHLKIGSKWDFVIPWPPKIAVTRSIFEIEGSNFGFSPLFVCSTNAILQLRLYDQFLRKSFF